MVGTTTQAPLLELQADVWKARAQAKQKWLERILAEPIENPDDGKRRKEWVDRALAYVHRAQEDMKFKAALIDAYTAHLNVLEMTLISASESRADTGASKR
jgi:hypothetical protein